jgi:single-stranded-DNA-specific exonuclease
VDELRQRLIAFARANPAWADLVPCLDVDAEVRLSDLDDETFQQMERLAPFGASNPQPVFVARDLAVIAEPRILKDKHLKFRVEQDGRAVDALGWNMASSSTLISQAKGRITLAFTLLQNDFQQMKSVQLIVKDIQTP